MRERNQMLRLRKLMILAMRTCLSKNNKRLRQRFKLKRVMVVLGLLHHRPGEPCLRKQRLLNNQMMEISSTSAVHQFQLKAMRALWMTFLEVDLRQLNQMTMASPTFNKTQTKAQRPWTCKAEQGQLLNRLSTYKIFTKCTKQIHIPQTTNTRHLIIFKWEAPLRLNKTLSPQIKQALVSMLLVAIIQQLRLKNHSCQWWVKWTICLWEIKICKVNKWDHLEANKMDLAWTMACNNNNSEVLAPNLNKWTHLAMVLISSRSLLEMEASSKHSNHLFQACRILVSISHNNKFHLDLVILNQRLHRSQETLFKMALLTWIIWEDQLHKIITIHLVGIIATLEELNPSMTHSVAKIKIQGLAISKTAQTNKVHRIKKEEGKMLLMVWLISEICF